MWEIFGFLLLSYFNVLQLILVLIEDMSSYELLIQSTDLINNKLIKNSYLHSQDSIKNIEASNKPPVRLFS